MLPVQSFYKELLDNLYDGVYFVDTDRKITYWNKGAERLTGYKAEQVVGHSCKDNILNHCTDQGIELCLTGCPLTATMNNGGPQEAEVYLHHASGHRVPVLVRVSAIRDTGSNIVGAVEIFSNNLKNVRARRQIQSLEQKALSDPLTGLGNREYLETQFRTALFQLEIEHSQHCLAFIDIDQFKHVNDEYGHNVGDMALKMVAYTLHSNLRDTDALARWGGDEFSVLLKDITADNALRIAEKLRVLIERSHISCETGLLRLTVSIGLTMLRSGDNIEAAIKRADIGMLKSKVKGRNLVTDN